MIDTMQIRTYIDARGVKLGHVADVLGVSSNTLRNKLNQTTDFKLSEVEKLSSLLRLTRDERDECFFGRAG